MTFRRVDLGMIAGARWPGSTTPATSATSCGSRPSTSATLFDRIVAAGEPHGLRLFGIRALMSLRLEKSYGTWFREYRPIYTPLEGGHAPRYIKLDHEFIGRAAHEAEVAAGGPERRLVAFVVEPDPDDPADVIGDEPIWHDGAVVGWVTSGGYGHHVKAVDRAGLRAGRAGDAGRPGRRAASRSRSSAGAGRPGSSPSRCSTRRVCGCASDRRPDGDGRRRPGGSSSTAGRSPFEPGDSVAIAILRAGEVPGRGGTLCLAGDCGNCLAEVDGIAYVRTCQTAGAAGDWRVVRHPAGGDAAAPRRRPPRTSTATPLASRIELRRLEVDVAVIGGGVERAGGGRRGANVPGKSVRRPRCRRRRRGRRDLRRADGRRPRRRTGCSTSTPHEVVVATGAAEIQPVCPGNDLAGLVTARAAERLHAAGVELGRRVAVGTPPAGVPCDAVGRAARPVRGRRATAASAPS